MLGMTAREAGLKAVADSELRRLESRDKSFDCSDAKIGVSALSYKAASSKSMPLWGGPAKILGIDVTGATAKLRSRTSKVARYCVGKDMDSQDMAEVERNPATGTSDTWDEAHSADRFTTQKNVGLPFEGEGDPTTSSTAKTRE